MGKRPRGTGSLYRRGKTWWIKYYSHGHEQRESTHSADKQDAVRLLRKRLGEIEAGTHRGLAKAKVTVGDLIDLVIEDYRFSKKRDLKTVEWRSGKHLRALGAIQATRFGNANVSRYVNARREDGAAEATINRELAIIRRGFQLGMQQDPPLVTRAPHIPKLAEDNTREGFVEHEQYLRLLEAMPPHLKALLVVGFHVGNRLGELRQLRWSQVDLKAGEIKLPARATKGKKHRTLPIYGDMAAWLAMAEADHAENWPTCPLVFHYLGRKIGSHLKGWKAACERAGLPGLRFHDLRRSAVRNLERAGVPRKVATEITGHKTESVYRRYDIVSDRDLKAAARKMETYFEAPVRGSLGTISGTEGEKVN